MSGPQLHPQRTALAVVLLCLAASPSHARRPRCGIAPCDPVAAAAASAPAPLLPQMTPAVDPALVAPTPLSISATAEVAASTLPTPVPVAAAAQLPATAVGLAAGPDSGVAPTAAIGQPLRPPLDPAAALEAQALAVEVPVAAAPTAVLLAEPATSAAEVPVIPAVAAPRYEAISTAAAACSTDCSDWPGHCAGASCTTYNDCAGTMSCISGKCGCPSTTVVCRRTALPAAPANSAWPATGCDNVAPNSICRAVCSAGSTGAPQTTCGASGTWGAVSGSCTVTTPTVCRRTGLLTAPANSTWPATGCDNVAPNSLCSGACSAGYSGSISTTCGATGAWSAVAGSCTATVCRRTALPAALANSAWPATGCDNVAPNSVCRAVCSAGSTGAPQTICGTSGTWGAVSGTCTATTPTVCSRTALPAAPANSAWPATGCDNVVPSSVCSGACSAGYSGSVSTTCGATGAWSAVAGSCTATPPTGCPVGWERAVGTLYDSWPKPGTKECGADFSGCKYAGLFSNLDAGPSIDQQPVCKAALCQSYAGYAAQCLPPPGVTTDVQCRWPEAAVRAFKVAATYDKDSALLGATLQIMVEGAPARVATVTIKDLCSDADCGNCCRTNTGGAKWKLIDVEKWPALDLLGNFNPDTPTFDINDVVTPQAGALRPGAPSYVMPLCYRRA